VGHIVALGEDMTGIDLEAGQRVQAMLAQDIAGNLLQAEEQRRCYC
jgi:hypothetical protein